MGKYKGNTSALPVKNLKTISVIGAEKLYKLDSEKLRGLVGKADIFLPEWDIMGIRNKMAYSGACAGLVSPHSPINPVSDEQRLEFEEEEENRKDPVQILGSLVRLIVCVVKPIIQKDELDAYALRIAYNSCNSGEVSDASVMAISKDAKTIAMERLTNKAAVSVQFYDVLLDYESESILTDSTGTDLPLVLNLLRDILEGRHIDNGNNILDSDKEEPITVEAGVVPYTRNASGSAFQHTARKIVDLTEFKKGNLYVELSGIFGDPDLFENKISYTDNSLPTKQFFSKAARGAVVLFGIEEWGRYLSKFIKITSKDDFGKKEYVGKLVMAEAVLREAAEESEAHTVLKKAVIKEAHKASFHLPFEGVGTDEKSLYEGALNSLLGVIYRSSMGVSEAEVQKVILEFAKGEFDVQADIAGNKAQLTMVTPSAKSKRLVPMQLGIEYIDLVDKVRNTVMIFKEVGEALRNTCELAYFFDFIMREMFMIVPYDEGK